MNKSAKIGAAIVLAWMPFASFTFAGDVNKGDCTLNGVKLYGKVQVVDSFPDLKVQIVDSFPDLNVQKVTSFPDSCGKWEFVDSFPDFKIQYVDSFPDLKIKMVNSFPGVA